MKKITLCVFAAILFAACAPESVTKDLRDDIVGTYLLDVTGKTTTYPESGKSFTPYDSDMSASNKVLYIEKIEGGNNMILLRGYYPSIKGTVYDNKIILEKTVTQDSDNMSKMEITFTHKTANVNNGILTWDTDLYEKIIGIGVYSGNTAYRTGTLHNVATKK